MTPAAPLTAPGSPLRGRVGGLLRVWKRLCKCVCVEYLTAFLPADELLEMFNNAGTDQH